MLSLYVCGADKREFTSCYDNLSGSIHEDPTDKDSVNAVPVHPIMRWM
jgi:hypothetical protein